MNDNLMNAFYKVVDVLKNDNRCHGGWHFGSLVRGLSDEYSDVDPIFLIKGKYFEEVAIDLPNIMKMACDNLVIFWKEGYNNDELKSFGCELEIDGKYYQFDIFIINDQKIDAWFCKLHYTDITSENIIFDSDGEISKLISTAPKGTIFERDINHSIITYWHHVHMVIKYFMREDYFKLHSNFNTIMQSHIELLLAKYDNTTWGGWDSKLKLCVPVEKQIHLKKYFDSTNIDKMKENLKESIEWFCIDAKSICEEKNIPYPQIIEDKIKTEYFTTFNFY
jgi:hypothetical protein